MDEVHAEIDSSTTGFDEATQASRTSGESILSRVSHVADLWLPYGTTFISARGAHRGADSSEG